MSKSKPSKKDALKAIREAIKEGRVEYHCCICRKATNDPCAVIFVTNWTKPRDEQNSQQFFAHRACIELVITPEVLDIE